MRRNNQLNQKLKYVLSDQALVTYLIFNITYFNTLDVKVREAPQPELILQAVLGFFLNQFLMCMIFELTGSNDLCKINYLILSK